MVYMLDETIGFPDPRDGEEDGLFAVGGDLSVMRLLLAYSHGIFPWYAFRAEDADPQLVDPKTGKPYIQWWCPMQRFVIFPDEIHISHSMRQVLRKAERGEYKTTINQAFDQVIDLCGSTREAAAGAWLGEDMKRAYRQLHEEGFAASFEVWDQEDNLIGGLYGVTIGNAFIGESMFSLRPNTSKLALIMLAAFAQDVGIKIIDCQLETSHLRSMGGRFIPYDQYLELLHPKSDN